MVSLAILFGILLAASVLVMHGTVAKNRWGINPGPVGCPVCGEVLPGRRVPRNLREALWGGCSCTSCEVEVDKWGRMLRGRAPGGSGGSSGGGRKPTANVRAPGRSFWRNRWIWVIPVLGLIVDAWLSGAVIIDAIIGAVLIGYAIRRR